MTRRKRLTTGIVVSFINDAQAKQLLVPNLFFWLMMIPFAMIGVGLGVLGIVTFFCRTHWIVDRNLLLIRSRIFGWKSEHEYVNARWKLTHIRRHYEFDKRRVEYRKGDFHLAIATRKRLRPNVKYLAERE